jgi:hypothetical protein
LLEKGHGVDLLLLLIGVVIAAIQFQIGDVEVSLNIISFERSSQHRVILGRTRSATHRKSFQSHIIVFYSKIFFLKIRSSAHVILFFQKIKKDKTKKIVLVHIVLFFTKKIYKLEYLLIEWSK